MPDHVQHFYKDLGNQWGIVCTIVIRVLPAYTHELSQEALVDAISVNLALIFPQIDKDEIGTEELSAFWILSNMIGDSVEIHE